MDLRILYEDKHIVVAEKPPGIASQKDKTNDIDMLELLRTHLQTDLPVLPVHRLDRPVGGVMVFAKTKKAAAALSLQILNKTFLKQYSAVVTGITKDSDILEDHLIKNSRLNVSKVVHKHTPGAKKALLTYQKVATVLEQEMPLTLLTIDLQTGRHHQIRAQLANHDMPIWGDTKYNDLFQKNHSFVHIALWAAELRFQHPTTSAPLAFSCPPPDEFPFSLFSE